MFLATVASVASAALAGCESRDDLDGRRRAIPGLTATETPEAQGQSQRELAFDLIDNRPAALLYHEGGLVASGRGSRIALLTGGAAGGWRMGAGSRPSIRVDGQVGHLRFPYDRDPGGIATADGSLPIALRFRPAARDQLVSLFLNGTKVGDVPLDIKGTAEYATKAPASLLIKGENELRLFFRYAVIDEGLRTAGALERVALGRSSAGTQSPLRVAPVEVGGVRVDALTLAGAGRLSYHLLVPRARPVLELRVTGSGTASVRVAPATGGSQKVWEQAATESWAPADKPAAIDLSEYAGQLVRLDLVSTAAVSWGHPRVMRDPDDAPSPAPGSAADHVVVWLVAGLRQSAVEGMPALGELAKAGFARVAMSRSPAFPASLGAILSGELIAGQVIGADRETFAERFKQAGYATSFFTNGRAVAGDSQGFERVVRLPAVRADELWKRALDQIKGAASKRSLTVIWANDAALPWSPNKALIAPAWRSYTGRVQPTATQWLSTSVRAGAPPLAARDKDYLRALYAAELAAVDGAIATMRADLDSLGLSDRAGIIVAGDRGQALFERGGFGDPIDLSPSAIDVPIVVLAPGRSASPDSGLRVASDVYATALDLGQIPAPVRSRSVSALTTPPATRVVRFRLPGKASGLAVGDYRYAAPRGAEPVLYQRKSGAESAIAPKDAPVAARALIGWLALLATHPAWDTRRWGPVTSLRAGFSSR